LRDLREKILHNKMLAHELFMTETIIASEYGVSRTTIKQVLDRMVSDGDLYRIQGKGTFVAPKLHTQPVLIVIEGSNVLQSRDFAQVDFFQGITSSTASVKTVPAVLCEEEFLKAVPDADIVFKDFRSIIFFRTARAYLASREQLERNHFTYLFYGSDGHFLANNLPTSNAVLCSEKKIVSLAIDHLIAHGHHQIGCLFSNSTIRYRRSVLFQELMAERSLPIQAHFMINPGVSHGNLVTRIEYLKTYLQTMEQDLPGAFLCTDDWMAAALYQAAGELAISIPKQFSVIGINDYTFSRFLYPPLTTIKIPVFEDAIACMSQLQNSHGAPTAVTYSQCELIERKSVQSIK